MVNGVRPPVQTVIDPADAALDAGAVRRVFVPKTSQHTNMSET